MQGNPFTPNFGQIPRYIAGRDQVINEVLYAFEHAPYDPATTAILVGARGTGKTALLSYLAKEAEKTGWISVNTACISGVQEDILQQTAYKAKEFLPKKSKTRLKGVSLGQIVDIAFDTKEGPEENWYMRMVHLLDELERHQVGLLITIDEVTPRLEEMIHLAATYQLLLRENRRIMLLMAGLPSQVSLLLNHESVSFLRRASQYTMQRLEDYEVEEVFQHMIQDGGKTITPEALDPIIRATEGFPYMMQLVGYRVWSLADNENSIGPVEAQKGIELAKKDFESRILRATVRELSDGDKLFLKAMLEDEGSSRTADLELRLNKNSGYISRYRTRLIEHGVIEPVSRGYVRMAIPGLREYLETVARG